MILASFTMSAHTLFLGFLFLYLTGVRSEQDTETHMLISNQIYTAQDNLGLTCHDACDETGEILECMVKKSGKCLSKYYLVCPKNRYGECDTINSSCPDESRIYPNHCGIAIKAKEDLEQFTRKQNRKSMRSNISGLKRLNNLYRRDLTASDDVGSFFSPKSAMVASSGNGHAFVLDGEKMAESHFGGPPVISSLTSDDTKDNLVSFPFSWMSSVTDKLRSGPDVIFPPTSPKEPDFYSQSHHPQYMPREPYHSPYGSDYGMQKYPPYYSGNTYGIGAGTNQKPKSKPYSPFSAFFNSVGLQDPMLMLQYLPIAYMPKLGKNPYLLRELLDQTVEDRRMPDWIYMLP